MLHIIPANLADPRIVALLQIHTTRALAETARGSGHALDRTGLQRPDIQVFAGWKGDDLLVIGALKRLDATTGELKSMHTAEAARRTGAGRAMLTHLIATARAAGMTQIYLETGSWPYFKPAVAFYQAHGFVPCPPFGAYQPDPNSLFFTLDLAPGSASPSAALG